MTGIAITLLVFFILFIIWVLIRCIYVPFPSPHCLYGGGPGSGKTMMLTRIAVRYHKKHEIYSNYNIQLPNVYRLNKSFFGQCEFPPGSICLFDEGSLNGYDNRDFKDNFKGNNSLEYMKMIRHFKNVIVWSNQGFDELDKKIRTLSSEIYIVRKLPFFSVAIRVFQRPAVHRDSKELVDEYKYANPLRLIFDPRCVQLCFRPYYGRLYDSWERPEYRKAPKDAYLSSHHSQ